MDTPRKRREPVKSIYGEVVAKCGFTQIPNVLLEGYIEMELDRNEFLFLVHLLRYLWAKTDRPYPPFRTLAGVMGLSLSRTRAIARSLDKKGFLKRQERRKTDERSESNLYDLSPLLKRLMKRADLVQAQAALKKQRSGK